MKNEEYEDFEQVYTVGDKEEFSGDGGSSVMNSDKGSLPVIVCIGLVVFLPLAFIALIASTIAKSCNSVRYGDIAVPLMFGCIAVAYIAITKYIGSLPAPVETEDNTATKSGKRKKKFKKFKNIDEHRGYLRGKGYNVDNDPRFNSGSDEPESSDEPEIDKKKVADEIELAIEALVRLGFGNRKAKDWVIRGISAGVKTSDTQALIKFALSRGASMGNNK